MASPKSSSNSTLPLILDIDDFKVGFGFLSWDLVMWLVFGVFFWDFDSILGGFLFWCVVWELGERATAVFPRRGWGFAWGDRWVAEWPWSHAIGCAEGRAGAVDAAVPGGGYASRALQGFLQGAHWSPPPGTWFGLMPKNLWFCESFLCKKSIWCYLLVKKVDARLQNLKEEVAVQDSKHRKTLAQVSSLWYFIFYLYDMVWVRLANGLVWMVMFVKYFLMFVIKYEGDLFVWLLFESTSWLWTCRVKVFWIFAPLDLLIPPAKDHAVLEWFSFLFVYTCSEILKENMAWGLECFIS